MTDTQRPQLELRRYTHLAPADGMCLMEYVSVLAGDRFTDEPRCTGTLLAALARAVNDTMSDEGRSRLIGLAPSLAQAGGSDPPEVVDRIEYLCWEAVCGVASPGTAIHRRAQRSRERVARRRFGGWKLIAAQRIRLHGPARRAMESAVRSLAELPPQAADRALYELLSDCIEAAGDPRIPAAPSPAGLLLVGCHAVAGSRMSRTRRRPSSSTANQAHVPRRSRVSSPASIMTFRW